MTRALHELTASEAATAMGSGATTSEALIRACLEHIETREPEIAAWAFVDRDAAITQARTRDMLPSGGALHGVPVAFKDIVDTAEMPTTYGSPIYRDHRPVADAACVVNSVLAGAVVLGKTVTTEFAARYPGPTRNPHDPTHTPGGSSSGSAAAVAECMVPLAVGTQTAGSVIRPASYCGIYGYKPTYGLVSFSGVRHLAESLDTLGCMAREIADLALFRNAMLGKSPVRIEMPEHPPRIGFCRTPLWNEATADTHKQIENAAERLAGAGAAVEEVELGAAFADSLRLHGRLMAFEGRNLLAHDRVHHEELLSSAALTMSDAGEAVDYPQYLEDQREAASLRRLLAEAMAGHDVLITPSAVGEAPKGLGFTGPVEFNYLWTLTHVPALTIPVFQGPLGLPVGLQLIGKHWADDHLLAAGLWVEANL